MPIRYKLNQIEMIVFVSDDKSSLIPSHTLHLVVIHTLLYHVSVFMLFYILFIAVKKLYCLLCFVSLINRDSEHNETFSWAN